MGAEEEVRFLYWIGLRSGISFRKWWCVNGDKDKWYWDIDFIERYMV
jgi:hypothetical protein